MNRHNQSHIAKASEKSARIHVFLEEEKSQKNKGVFTNYFCIGRDKGLDVCINDQSVSRLHAVVYFSKGKWWILDTSSLNGTIVNGKKIIRYPLETKTKLRLGWDGPLLNLSALNNGNPQKLKEDPEETTHLSSTKVRVRMPERHEDQKEWVFTRHFSIGRHTGADIRIDDASVSRFHTIVNFKEGKWWIQDMNSTNGTFVNGQKVFKEQLDFRTRLRLGRAGPKFDMYLEKLNALDRESGQQDLNHNENNEYTIIGEVESDVKKTSRFPEQEDLLSFTEPALETEKKESLNTAQPPLKKNLKYLIIVAPVIVLGIVLAVYGYLQENRIQHQYVKKDIAAKTLTDNQNDSSDSPGALNHEMEIDGASTNEVAEQKINAVENKDDKKTIEQKDIPLSQISDIYFNAAKTFYKDRNWNLALKYYKNVSEINPDYPELGEKIKKAQFEIANQNLYAEGKAYLEEGRYEESIERLKNISEKSVYYEEVSKRIAKAVKKQNQQKLAEVKAAKNKKAKIEIAQALKYYADGKIKSSLKHLNHVLKTDNHVNPMLKSRARNLTKRINDSSAMYYRGIEEYVNDQRDMAIQTWKQLLIMDQKLINGKSGYFNKSVSRKMANQYCLKALKAISEGDWPSAHQYNKLALKLKSDHAKSLQLQKMIGVENTKHDRGL